MSKNTMKAIGLYDYLPIENPNSLVDVTIPRPKATAKDILVKIEAISVNPVDTKVRAPKDKKETSPKIMGWDAAGVVIETGEDVTFFKPGDEVYYARALNRPGSYSEYQLVDGRIAAKKPASLSFPEAAALPLTSITAWEGLFERLRISKNKMDNQGKTILIINAAGGVGSIAVQLAKWAGLTVIGTASRNETAQWAKQYGTDAVINHHKDFGPQLKELGYGTVDYIFCLNATDTHWEKMADVIKPQGAIAAIAESPEKQNLSLLQSKSVTFVWEFMFTRSLYQTDDMVVQHQLLKEVAELIDQDIISTTLNQSFSPINAENLRKAHEMVESGRMIGKVVLSSF